MIQRLLFTALFNAVARIASDTTLVNQLFAANYGLLPNEVAAIQTYFSTNPPKVVQGYARADAKMPLYAVLLQGEAQSDYSIGDNAGMTMGIGAGQLGYGCETIGTFWDQNFQIYCYAENPDMAVYMYEIAKSALLVNRTFFQDNGVIDPMVSGMDLAPDPRYLPEHLFCRVLAFRCKQQLELVDYDSGVGRAFQITGIAVPPGTSQSNGGAETLVTVDVPTR